MERSQRSLRWTMHKFAKNGRGLQQGYIARKSIENALWPAMMHHNPSLSLVNRHRAIHSEVRFAKALHNLPQQRIAETDLRFKRRMTVAFAFFRLAASFFLVLFLGSAYAAVTNAGLHAGPAPARVYMALGMQQGRLISSQEVSISGTVWGIPNYNLLQNAKVVALNPENNQRLDSTLTNAEGNYQMSFQFVSVPEQAVVQSRLFPNPFGAKTSLRCYAPEAAGYVLNIKGADGKTLLNTDISLDKGNNEINLTGGQAGVRLITLMGNNSSQTYKGIQLESTGAPITYDVAHTDFSGPMFKSTLDDILMVGDEVRLEFTKDGYQYGDTTFIVQTNNTANKNLQQIPTTFTTTLKPYLDDGTPVTTLSPGWTTTLEFPAPVGTKTYTPNGNNEINISEEFYPLNGELGNVTIHHDTTNYTVGGVENGVLSWIVIRPQNQSTTVRNKAQTSSSNLVPEPTTTVSLDSLDGQVLNYYTLPKKAETQPGTMFNLLDARGWMMASGDGLQTSKFIDLPYNVADSLLIITDKLNMTTGTPVSTTNLDRVDFEESKILNLYNLANNDIIIPKTSVSRSQPGEYAWNKAQNRGFVNTVFLYFYQGTPANSRAWKADYTYDGEIRLDNCTGMYHEQASDGQIYEENYSATTGIEEGSGSLITYIRGPTGEPTDLAGRMARWTKLLDLGSGNSKKSSSANNPKPKEIYSYTAEGQAPIFSTDAKPRQPIKPPCSVKTENLTIY